MEIFFLLIFALVAFGVFANLFGKLNDLRSNLERLDQQAADRIRALEARLGAQERLSAQLTMELAERPLPPQETSATASVVTPPIPEPEQKPVSVPTPPPTPATELPIPALPHTGTTHAPLIPNLTPVESPISVAYSEPPPIQTHTEHAPPPPPPPPAVEPAYHAHQPAPEPAHSVSLEERFGVNWLSKLGIISVVVGLAFLLGTRFQTMGPVGKVLTGLGISFGLLAGGVWLERKQTYRILARAGIGGGWALLFFTTYAMHHLDAARIIQSLIADLLLMLLVAAAMVLHSLRYKSQTVTGLAFLLGYLTVATSHLESANNTVVFSLLASAVLALGLVVVTTLRHWAWLELAGLIGVMANHFLWLSLVLPATRTNGGFPLAWPSIALILFYWIIFRAAYLLRKPLDDTEDRVSSLSAVITGGGVIGLLKYQSTHPEWAFRALLVLGTIELLLGVWARNRRRSAFVVLTTIGTVLLIAAIPFHFHGVSWPILWIAEAHVLALCGLRLDEPIFRRLGLIAGFCASVVLALHDLAPLIVARLSAPDPSHHWTLSIGLALAAALFWLHGELYPRRWPEIAAKLEDYETLALQATSWLGVAAAASALWVLLPSEWVPAAWLMLVLMLGLAADWKSIVSLALQADLLAACTIAAVIEWDFVNGPGVQKLPAAVAIALFYAGMRRRTALDNSPAYVAPAYSWIATAFLLCWIPPVVNDEWLALSWAVVALVLFELGRFFHKGFLRWQGILTAILSILALQVDWIGKLFKITTVRGWLAAGWQTSLSALAVIALAYWLQERIYFGRRSEACKPADRFFAIVLGAAGTLLLAAWLPMLFPSWGNAEAEPILWAALASGLLAVTLLVHRRIFQVHAIAGTLLVALYAAYLWTTGGPSRGALPWWQDHIAQIAIASAILLAGLPFAFRLRSPWSPEERWSTQLEAIRHPKQWFFFVPYAVMIGTLAVELRARNITLAWSLLGLGAFLFALLVRERSFRLGGLALLMLSVVKILLIDVWTLPTTDRITTLIVMGCALLLVSFLYTRFKETFRRIL